MDLMTTDPTPLQERIAKTICNTPDRGDEWRDDWSEIPEYDRDFWMDAAAAVLPIIAAEVRKAQAEAWQKGWNVGRRFQGPNSNPYREQEG